MAKSSVDVDARHQLRMTYLKAMYEKEARERKATGQTISMSDEEVVSATGMSTLDAEKSREYLYGNGYLDYHGGVFFGLTSEGREFIEDWLHEKNRPAHRRAVDLLRSPAVIGGIAGAIMSLIVNVLAASDIPWWIKLLMKKH